MHINEKISHYIYVLSLITLICIICLSDPALGKGIKSLIVEEGETMTLKDETLFIGKNIVIEPDATLILENTSILRWKGDSTQILMGENSSLFLNASQLNTSVIAGSSVRAVTFDNSDLRAEEITLHASEIRFVSSTISFINISGAGRVIEVQDSTIDGERTYLESIFIILEGSTIDSHEIKLMGVDYINVGKTALIGDVKIGSLLYAGNALIQMQDVYLDWSNFTLHSPPLTLYNTFTARVTNPTDIPVTDAEVLIHTGDKPIGSATTDQDGFASFNLLAGTIHGGKTLPSFINYTAIVHFTNSTASTNFTLEVPLTTTLREEPPPPEPIETSTPTAEETFDWLAMIENESESSALVIG